MKAVKVIYFVFKALVIVGLIVGIGVSRQCNDQMVEICKLVGKCEDL